MEKILIMVPIGLFLAWTLLRSMKRDKQKKADLAQIEYLDGLIAVLERKESQLAVGLEGCRMGDLLLTRHTTALQDLLELGKMRRELSESITK